MAGEARPVPVLVNPSAGSAGGGAAESLRHTLAKAGVRAELRPVEPQELAAAVRREVERGTPVVAVAGGDGSLSTAAGALAWTGTALAPIPLGTLNHFAGRHGLATVEDAARAIAGGRIADVPVGTLGDQVFINNVTCGYYPRVLVHRESWRRWLGKWPAALAALVYVYIRMRWVRLTFETPRERLRRTTAVVWIGLGRGSFRLPEREDHASGDVLEVVIPEAHSRAGFARLAVRVLGEMVRGEPPRDQRLEILHVPALTIAARHPIYTALDGETARIRPPLELRFHAAALKVVVPEP